MEEVLVQASEAGEQSSDLVSFMPGHCPVSIAACKVSDSGNTLDKKGSGLWNSEALGGLTNRARVFTKSYDSQDKINSIVKMLK